jgi:hypothetical protein
MHDVADGEGGTALELKAQPLDTCNTVELARSLMEMCMGPAEDETE